MFESNDVILEEARHRLVLRPRIGGSIAAYFDEHEGEQTHWLRPAPHNAISPLQMASFPLVPWCNRIRNGRASFKGRRITLEPNHPAEPHSPHALHGIGWLRPWHVTERSSSSATLRLEVRADAQWPWSFIASQRYALRGDRLECTMGVRNTDTAPMPAALGHHPYFQHLPGTRLQAHTRAMWATDAEVLPVGLEQNQVVEHLREGVMLRQLDLDNNFTGWQRRTRIDWLGRGVELTAQSPLDFFVLYCPPAFDFFCAEPVSQCTDAINLEAARIDANDLGGTTLAPNEELEAQWQLTPHAG